MPHPDIFIVYSRKDERWADRILGHLRVLERQSIARAWVDHQIRPGSDWLSQTLRALGSVDVAVLLISADFLGSEFIQNREIPILLERRKQESLHVFPLLVRDCVWEEVSWLAPLQIWPRSGLPLSALRGNRIDAELKLVVREVLRSLREARSQKYAEA